MTTSQGYRAKSKCWGINTKYQKVIFWFYFLIDLKIFNYQFVCIFFKLELSERTCFFNWEHCRQSFFICGLDFSVFDGLSVVDKGFSRSFKLSNFKLGVFILHFLVIICFSFWERWIFLILSSYWTSFWLIDFYKQIKLSKFFNLSHIFLP